MAPSASFGNDYTHPTIEEINEEMMVSKVAAERLVKIVKRCEEAKKSGHLDLSECQLTRIPDEIFDLVRDAKLKSCDLSNNVIRKLPPKFSIEFSHLTDLNLSNNEIYKLPDEFAGLTLLVRLDISNNYLLNLPAVLFKLPKLRQLKAHHNAIIAQLQKLCRTLQAERTSLLDVLKANNIERPPMPELPPEPVIEPPKSADKLDIMSRNCSKLKKTLAVLQGRRAHERSKHELC